MLPSCIAAAVLMATATMHSTRIFGQPPPALPLRIEQPRLVDGRAMIELVKSPGS